MDSADGFDALSAFASAGEPASPSALSSSWSSLLAVAKRIAVSVSDACWYGDSGEGLMSPDDR